MIVRRWDGSSIPDAASRTAISEINDDRNRNFRIFGFLINLFPSYLLQNTQLIPSQTGISTEKTERRDRKIIHITVSSSHQWLPTRTDVLIGSSLPEMPVDAVPTSSSSSGTDALPSASSSNALPKVASNHKTVFVKASEGTSVKDQNSASQKKKKPWSRVGFEIHHKFLTFAFNFSFPQTNFASLKLCDNRWDEKLRTAWV